MELITSMKKKKTRLIVRKGNENIALKVEDIAFIYRDNTIIVAVDKEEKKYLCGTVKKFKNSQVLADSR